MVTRGIEVYQGKAKKVFETSDPNIYWVRYKDSLTAQNGLKKAEKAGKGNLNNAISSYIFEYLKQNGIKNHYLEQISENEMLVKKVSILPVEVVVRNTAADTICKRLGLKEKTVFKNPLIEFYYKNDQLSDPLITESHMEIMNIATKEQIEIIKKQALKINSCLKRLFLDVGLNLVDFKIEFGIDTDGQLILADEVSPDTCRLWDIKTGQVFDKDLFRKDMGSVITAYSEVMKRLKGRKQKMKFKVEVIVEFKKGILDPQSQAIAGAITSMGYDTVKTVNMGKRFNLDIVETSKEKAQETTEQLCKKLLSNPVIENYQYTIEEEK